MPLTTLEKGESQNEVKKMEKKEYVKSWEEHINDLNRLRFTACDRDDQDDAEYIKNVILELKKIVIRNSEVV